MEIKIKKLTATAKIPTRESASAAGYDLYADITDEIRVKPHETVKVNTGVAMEIPEGYFGGIAARSGLASKEGLRPANCYGIVDSDYRGEIIVPLINLGESDFIIEKNMRIAQLVAIPVIFPEIAETDSLSDTQRGSGGFGSTGI